MSHFYANIQGSRGEATRCGTKNSGITGHIRGWNIGVEVHLFVGPYGDDMIEIWQTKGSKGAYSDRKSVLLIGDKRPDLPGGLKPCK